MDLWSCKIFLYFGLFCQIFGSKISEKCPDDHVPDLNGKCVKRFVLPSRKPCPTPDIKFGGFELELDGRIAKFWCEEGWSLVSAAVGHSHAMCKLGQWDRPLPACLRPGCDEIRSPDDGFFTYEVNGALVRFFCSDDRILVGDSVLGCDGQFWNGTTPTCVIPTTTTTSTTPRPKSFSANDLTSSGASWTSFEAGFIAVCLTVVAVSSSRNLAQ